jgi:hypothetical protein
VKIRIPFLHLAVNSSIPALISCCTARGYVPDAPPDLWRRYLAIIFDGRGPQGARPLPGPPPASL